MQTPPGRGGIAVLALRGPEVDAILAEAFRPVSSAGSAGESGAAAHDNVLQLGHVVDGPRVIDQAIVARRGDLAEINIHGGPAAAAAVLHRLGDLGAVVLPASPAATICFRPSHPAMHNPARGAEMLGALPDAASPRVAAALTQQWSAGLSELAARVLDHVPARSAAELRAAATRRGIMRRVLCPAEVVLAGAPNAGKSTLANALLGRAASIVHDRPGTTRDWVREQALFRGLPVWLTDTAGLWETPDSVDAEAVRRTGRRIAAADLVLLLGDGRMESLPAWLGELCRPGKLRVLRVATKTDIAPPPPEADAAVCALTGQGLDELALRIMAALGLGDFDATLPAAFTDRQEALLTKAADALDTGQAEQARATLRELLA